MLGLDVRILTTVALLVAGNPQPPSGDRVVFNGDPVKLNGEQVILTAPASGQPVTFNGDRVTLDGSPLIFTPE